MSVYTIATLLLKEDEVLELTQKFVDTVGATYSLMLTFKGQGWGDHETIWAEVKMGAPSIMAYRVLLEDTFGPYPYLTDSRFHTHLSIFKNVEAIPH